MVISSGQEPLGGKQLAADGTPKPELAGERAGEELDALPGPPAPEYTTYIH